VARRRRGAKRVLVGAFCRRNSLLKRLVGISRHRWVIERDYEELKQELGLDHYEGRNWRGFTTTQYCALRLTAF